MKGLIGKAVAVVGCASALAGVGGCYTYRDLVDPCYPERYWYMSRQETNAAMAPQVQNGHVIDQTMWNYHFDPGTDRLTQSGLIHLAYLARRRPFADPVVFLQTAHDLVYDPAKPADFPANRQTLDTKRMAAIKGYLAAETAGGRSQAFEVVVHNPPPDIGLFSVPVTRSLVGPAGEARPASPTSLYGSPIGTLPRSGNVGGGGGAGGGGGGGR